MSKQRGDTNRYTQSKATREEARAHHWNPAPKLNPPAAGAGAGAPNENPPNGAGGDCLASAGLLAAGAAAESAPNAELKMSAAVEDGVLEGAAADLAAPNGVPNPKLLLEVELDPALG